MSEVKKIVFLGSKPIGADCLAYLLQQQEVLNYEVVAIGTKDRKEFSAENPIRELAAQHHIPLIQHPDEIPTCDIIYSVQYHKILKETHIQKAKTIAVNLHLAPLPEYRGCNQFSFAIFHGATHFGVTIHQIDAGVDSGPILFEDRFLLDKNIWVKDLYALSVQKGLTLFQQTLADLINANYEATQQTQLIASRGLNEFKRKDIDIIKQLNFEESASKTQARIRASYMPGFAPPYFLMDGKKISISIDDN